MKERERTILVTGGCGYVGTVLVPKIAARYPVVVLDTMMFGNHLGAAANVTAVKGDIQDVPLVRELLRTCTDVVHLASIANDPCSELDPGITQSVNRDAVEHLVRAARERGLHRFINASSSAVYGVKEEESVTEDLPLAPLTLYARLKAETERIVAGAARSGFATASIRSATVCGYSARMRFDVIVNMMAKMAIADGTITVHGGGQYRPNIHIQDITDLYLLLLEIPAEKIGGRVFNAGSKNHTVLEIARMAEQEAGGTIRLDSNVTDNRSYRISSGLIRKELGWEPRRTIRDAIRDIKQAFDAGLFPNPNDDSFYNIRTMKNLLVARRERAQV